MQLQFQKLGLLIQHVYLRDLYAYEDVHAELQKMLLRITLKKENKQDFIALTFS